MEALQINNDFHDESVSLRKVVLSSTNTYNHDSFQEGLKNLSGFLKRRRREITWPYLCNRDPVKLADSDQLPVKAEEDSLPMLTDLDEGLHFISSLQLSGYDRDLLEQTLEMVTGFVFYELCPRKLLLSWKTKEGLHQLKTHVGSLNRFAVVDVLIRAMFTPPRVFDRDRLHLPDTEFPGPVSLGLVGAESTEYRDSENTFLDKVLTRGKGTFFTSVFGTSLYKSALPRCRSFSKP